MLVDILNSKVQLRDYYCSLDNLPPSKVEAPYINLYIQLNGCNADCGFCEYKTNGIKFNFDKFRNYLSKMVTQLEIRKISITGGEPTLNLDVLYKIIDIIKEISPDSFLVMNTNGFQLENLEIDDKIRIFDSISVSRHHYDHEINNEIFRTDTISNESLKRMSIDNPGVFHISCNVIKGYIDTPEEMEKYLEFCGEIEIRDVGFVGLMGINQYSKERMIDLTVDDLSSDRLNVIKEWKFNDVCKCNNYIYILRDISTLKLYHRHVLKPTSSETFVFDGETLRKGFNGIEIK